VKIVDGILNELANSGDLAPEVHPEALRSALMGAVEGMLRDQMLAASSRFPANYSDVEVRKICFTFLASTLTKP
jgi:hypothetical protein